MIHHPLGHFPCEQCKRRAHPFDLIANTTKGEKDEFERQAAHAKAADTTIKRTSVEWENFLKGDK